MVEIKYDSQKGTGETNQDFILCKQLDDSCLIFILADGMGGYNMEILQPRLLHRVFVKHLPNTSLTI